MRICRQIFVICARAVYDANGRYSLWCSVLNCKINTPSWLSRGSPMKTAYRRLCIAIFAIYVRRHMYVWHACKMKLLWFDGNGYLCRYTKNRQRLNCCIGEHLSKMTRRRSLCHFGQRKILIQACAIQFDAIMIWNDLCLEYICLKQWNIKYLVAFPHRQLQFRQFCILHMDNKIFWINITKILDTKISFRNIGNRHRHH